MPRNRNTPQELTLCTYAALYDASDFGGIPEIFSLGFRSLDSIKMKVQNIAAMFDEEGIERGNSVKGLSGKPHGEIGRRTDWEFVSKYLQISKSDHLAECIAILYEAQNLPGDITREEAYREGTTRPSQSIFMKETHERGKPVSNTMEQCVPFAVLISVANTEK